MRSEAEMLDLILESARGDNRVRAVIMNGSRVNPSAQPDIFQDFDILYLVTDVEPFQADPTWIERFGELMIMQTPDAMGDPPPRTDGRFAYLMQFMDGNRIDLTLYPIAKLDELELESLSLLLLDKDEIVGQLDPPNEGDYLPSPPTAKAFADCCNEFWWVCPYVAKGLWREEILYAKYMMDCILREQLMRMLIWQVGAKTHFGKNPGKFGANLAQFLDPDARDMLERTYADASSESTWDSLSMMGTLFSKSALSVAEHFGFVYPESDDVRVRAHLRHVRRLPKSATEMY